MKKAMAWPFEAAHMVGVAFFFALAAMLTLLSAPGWLAKVSPASFNAGQTFQTIASLIGRNAIWLAAAALLGAVVAPFARGDGKKKIAWTRMACVATVLVLVVLIWGRIEGGPKWLDGGATSYRSDRTITPWNVLLLAAGLDLGLAAFAVGAAQKSAKKKEAKPA